ncbi:cytochrome d ubiquinol oxidase subunit II [Candidatus Bealeia paramacronuclearis]|uniref:cytochrome d ubiquinol oxidase subunit II n=1 Tax=Candidatus Bealeia paramacronuclearis TaxID=1921001 RepID=UPI0039C0DDB7
MDFFSQPDQWLPLVFAALMGLSILIYVILDGYDLGVGILFAMSEQQEKDVMIASIGPFWDANETWLVLAVGLLLIAFPIANGMILEALYIPVALMLLGLILRGVAFEFRAKVPDLYKDLWNQAFFMGSLLTSLCQGYMLGLYIMGLEYKVETILFASLTSICLTLGYVFIGASWLIMKTEGVLQMKAVKWAQGSLSFIVIGILAVSTASPLVSDRIFSKWFTLPEIIFLAPLPLFSSLLIFGLWNLLKSLPQENDRWCWGPFVGAVGLFTLSFIGIAYSFYPYIVPEKLTIYECASAPESLMVILIGTLLVLPAILGYTFYSYKVFFGKTRELRYD